MKTIYLNLNLNLLILFIYSFLIYGVLSSAIPSIVTYEHGSVKGQVFDNHVIFRNIPYSKPPVGDLRWEHSVPPEKWNGTRDCTYIGHVCPQDIGNEPMNFPLNGTSEDCLTLVIQAPLDMTKKHPVYVFVPGGGFIHENAYAKGYMGETFPKKGIVVVTFNYRIGALGFLANDDEGLSGNYGFTDQIAALKWVKNYIYAFGGDPNDVTLGGISSGAMSVIAHIVSPASAGLFHKAVVESAHVSSNFKTMKSSKEIYKKFALKLNCSTLACLKKQRFENLVKVQEELNSIDFTKLISQVTFWSPIFDEKILPHSPFKALENGSFNKVPVLIGTVNTEGDYFAYGFFQKPITSRAYLPLIIRGMIGDVEQSKFQRIVNYYSDSKEVDFRRVVSDILGDVLFYCPNRLVIDSLIKHNVSTYYYKYNYIDHVNIFEKWKPGCTNRTCHADEVIYVFNSFKNIGFPANKDEVILSNDLSNYWTNFIINGDPNKGSMLVPLKWPVYNANGENDTIFFDTKYKLGNVYKQNLICDIIDEIGYDH